ncbi:PaaI family thioesterase [Vibrio mediterranei]|uniref:PaaI family thioesterase n=1 Tax=Vibrio mediterranei TaxID=689 RepID=UPI00148BE653|nr:PaaI family thioesterase [Vibrio mediterranei]NOH31444.1 PaaI family thioesterase [Vibrio mediterranei]
MSIHHPINHQQCAICCQPFFNPHTTLEFIPTLDGGVKAKIVPMENVQGYQDVMQGGAISALHDAAMTHCLFSRDVCAMTAQLDVRFIKPIPLNTLIEVQAHCLKSKRGLYILNSSIYVDGECYSRAEAKFM